MSRSSIVHASSWWIVGHAFGGIPLAMRRMPYAASARCAHHTPRILRDLLVDAGHGGETLTGYTRLAVFPLTPPPQRERVLQKPL